MVDKTEEEDQAFDQQHGGQVADEKILQLLSLEGRCDPDRIGCGFTTAFRFFLFRFGRIRLSVFKLYHFDSLGLSIVFIKIELYL